MATNEIGRPIADTVNLTEIEVEGVLNLLVIGECPVCAGKMNSI
jgi:hypothetical protein